MRLRTLTFAAGLLSAALAARADTLAFGSFTGSSAAGLANGAVTYSNTMGSGSVLAYQYPTYATPFSGTQYVSYTTSTSAAVNYTTTYTTSYTGNLAGYSGSLSILVDNAASVYLNGILLGSASSFTSASTFAIASSDFVNGTNIFTFNVLNDYTGGPTAFDFKATAASPSVSVTPEPSAIVLLGTGAFGIAALMRRRAQVAGLSR